MTSIHDRPTPVEEDIRAERQRQNQRWNEHDLPDGTGLPGDADTRDRLRILYRLDHHVGRGTWRHLLNEAVANACAETDPATLRAELIKVAAAATAWIEAIDRRAPTDQAEARVSEANVENAR